MEHVIKSVVLGLSLFLANGSIAYAQDYKKGSEAYEKKDYATALNEWRLLAAQGNAEAQFNVGTMYSEAQGVPQDYKEAARWYRLAADQGAAYAQYDIGWLYLKGKGVTQDYKEAVNWFRLAAEQGNAKAQTNLGAMYAKGEGVTQHNVYAHMWFNVAASNGNPLAVTNRDITAGKMTDADISKAQDLARACVQKNYKGC